MTLTPLVHQVRDLAGELVLDIGPSTGYRRESVTGNAGTIWRENIAENGPYVGGSSEVTPAVPAASRRVERIKVVGDEDLADAAYWRQVEDRVDALVAAVSTRFLWTVNLGGHFYTYRTVGPASVDASEFTREMRAGGYRVAILTFTVQPNPSRDVTLGGP